jgi:hypothetical protein
MAITGVYDRSFTAGDHAAGLDECADALSYAARSIRNPGEIDRVAANLSSTLAKFPRAFGSMRDWLLAELAAGRIVDGAGPDTTSAAVRSAESALEQASNVAWELHKLLEELHGHVCRLSIAHTAAAAP